MSHQVLGRLPEGDAACRTRGSDIEEQAALQTLEDRLGGQAANVVRVE